MSKIERDVRLLQIGGGSKAHIALDGIILCQASQTEHETIEVDRSEDICSNCKRWGRKIGVLEETR